MSRTARYETRRHEARRDGTRQYGTRRRATLLAVVVALGLLLGACSSGGSGEEASDRPASSSSTTSTTSTSTTTADATTTTTAPSALGGLAATTTTTRPATTPAPPAPPPLTGSITVYAAQSLSNAFTDIGKLFEARNPGTSVRFNFAGSATLVTQIFQGAPADVFASADEPNMDRVVSSGLMAGTPRIFTKNLLQIVVARGNPKGIAGLADLARSDVDTVLCAPAVPCGNYARQALSSAGVSVTPKSNEQNVAAVLGRVANGEADAGIVYVSDVLASNRVDGVVIPASQNVVAEYPLAALKDASNPVTAEAFVRLVQSPDGQAVLAKYGFLPL